jgi:hypothetical protein
MKTILLIFLFLLPFISPAQFTEDFADGNFTANPAWNGDVSKWQVNSGQLHSNSSVANDVFYLSTPSTLATDAQWEIFIKLDFSTSSNNYVDVYIVSDSANLKGPLHGYFVRLGMTPDEVSLYRKDGTAVTKIIDGVDGRTQVSGSSNAFMVKVKRSSANDWMLQDDNTGTGNNYFTEGVVNDGMHTGCSYFGISVAQSSSGFFSKHYFDNIYAGPIIQDSLPPVITGVHALTELLLDIVFSETVDQLTASAASNYAVSDGIGNPISAMRDAVNLSTVHLVFTTPFSDGVTHTVVVNNVKDAAGNSIAVNSTALFTYYAPVVAMPGDIVINEVLFNARIGGVEFVELYNASPHVIDLKNMKITKEDLVSHIPDAPSTITAGTYLMLPGEYLVLSDDEARVKSQYYTANANAFRNMNLPDLLTNEDIVLLWDANGTTIDALHYYASWHFPLLNSVDGVSLERLSFSRATQDSTNWHSASEAAGFATPGYKNSQYDDSYGDGSVLSVDPDIFSPDNDGYHDLVNVHYHFNIPGNVANVRVYDAKGRLTRNLVNNELLGNDGSFVWDGITNNKDKARTGIYIFYIEVFNVNGDTQEFKKMCVLASKL